MEILIYLPLLLAELLIKSSALESGENVQ